jgi:hypothetical protein
VQAAPFRLLFLAERDSSLLSKAVLDTVGCEFMFQSTSSFTNEIVKSGCFRQYASLDAQLPYV